MKVFTLEEASRNMQEIFEHTTQNSDETLIVADGAAVVMVNQRDWEEIQETLHIFNDKRALKALLDGLDYRAANQSVVAKTVDEVFHDLQN